MFCPKLWYIRNILRPKLCYTRKYYVSSPKWCYIWQCCTSDPILPMEIWCLLSELTLHTNMCNVRTYVTHKYELYSIRTSVSYRNVMCPNVCYKWKYDVWCLKLISHKKKRCNVRTHVTQENMMPRVQTYVTYKICNIRTYVTYEHESIFCPN